MEVGYARVSSAGQSLEVQLQKLSGCEKVFQEKKSGRNADNREQLQACLDFVREGDVLVISKLDRVSRSVKDLFNIVNVLDNKGVSLKVLDQQIDTSTAHGKMLFGLLGIISEFENDLRKERQMDGLAVAKAKGVVLGRKRSLSDDEVQQMRQKRNDGVMIKDLMKEFGLSKASVYNYLN